MINTGFLDIDRCHEILGPFQERWRDLAREAESIGAKWIEHPDSYYAPTGWYLSPVRYFGIDNPDAHIAAPLLSQLVAGDSRVMTAMYLRMGPHTDIEAHKGRSVGIGRFHLGLKVPNDCALKIGSSSRSWEEGGWLAFDDSFEHKAWNHSDSDRIILQLDFEHPDIPIPRRAYASRFIQGTYYDLGRRSTRLRTAIRWYNRAVRRKLWPIDTTQ